jgi:hypothetical protein
MIARRCFLMTVAAAGAGVAPLAQAQAMVDEKDPQAAGLGYVADAKRVDTKKYPKYAAGQTCTNCALYQGKAADNTLYTDVAVIGAGTAGMTAYRSALAHTRACWSSRRRLRHHLRPRGLHAEQAADRRGRRGARHRALGRFGVHGGPLRSTARR